MSFGYGYGYGFSFGGGSASIDTIDWFNTTNVSVTENGHSLISGGGTDSSWTARNPWSETISVLSVFDTSFILTSTQIIMFGVAKTSRVANNYTDIDYLFSRQGDALYIYELGIDVYTFGAVGNDLVCRIVSDGIDVKYYYNGILMYTSLVPPVGEYKFKTSLYDSTDNSVNLINF